MTLQTLLTLALVVLATLYFLRTTLRSLLARGCASGCGSCASATCPAKKLQALEANLPPKG